MEDGYKNYRIKYDYHTHTIFSHGKGTIKDNVRMASQKGLRGIAIADHGPGHLFYGIKKDKIPEMRSIVEKLRREYEKMDIFLAVEANIIHVGNCLDILKEEYGNYDFILAGYHYGVRNGYCIANYLQGKSGGRFGGTHRMMIRNTEMTLRAIYENPIKVLTHPGDKGPFDILEIAKACESRGTLMEINSHHENLTVEQIKIAGKTGVEFIISSDAHRPSRVGDCECGIARALEAGLDMERIVNVERFK